jgi:uncharacterized protein YbjT (DUF2867 family)
MVNHLNNRIMYVITGASGNTGRIVVQELLSHGKKVKVIGRDAGHLKALTDKGAEPLIGDLTDGSFMKKAFSGAEAVYLLIPPNPKATDFRAYQNTISDNYAEAIKSNGVKYVVLLSSIGAHLRHGAGVIDGLGYLEEKLAALKDVNVLNLRPTYFMENLFSQIDLIKQAGIAGSSIRADLRFPMVVSADVGAVAARRLNELKFKGNTVEYLLGPSDHTFAEVTAILGKEIGKPDLKYVQFSYEDAKKAMTGSGYLSENMADLYNQMSESFNRGIAFSDYKRTPENSTPTRIEDFAKIFAGAFGK